VDSNSNDDGAKTLNEHYGKTEAQLKQISSIYNGKSLCEHLVSSVNIATTYCDDIDARNMDGVISNDRHSKATLEELARKWNIGLQTAKDTIHVTMQRGIRTAIHPMTWRVYALIIYTCIAQGSEERGTQTHCCQR
jgi:hypothetical protein